VGGGIRNLEDAVAVFSAGADKISLNSAALADPGLITRIAERFGSQAVVVAIDAKRRNDGHWEAFSHGGRAAANRDAAEWAREAESRGAGEILLTSMDRDGTAAGFDCPLTRAVADSVRIPRVAPGILPRCFAKDTPMLRWQLRFFITVLALSVILSSNSGAKVFR
jgi:cyclase